MMKSRMLALLIPLALFGSSVRADDLRTAMEASNKQWLEAFNTPRISDFPVLYTDDAILIPGGMSPAVPGPQAIAKFWEGSIKAGFKDHTLEIVQTGADGNLAYVLSSWTVKKVGGGPTALT
jgi:ketosteroid isomerase-like protein